MFAGIVTNLLVPLVARRRGAQAVDHPGERRQQARVLPRSPASNSCYWGWYSNATRGGRRRRQEEGGATPTAGAEPGDEAKSRRLSWSQLIRKVYEVDPLLCTFCGAAMRIVAFIVERSSLRRILQHLDGDGQQPEPLAHSPPTEAEPALRSRASGPSPLGSPTSRSTSTSRTP